VSTVNLTIKFNARQQRGNANLTQREKQELREARLHKKDFISFVGSILSKHDHGFDESNLPSPYDEAKAASDTEAPNADDVGHFVRDKL
jgi:hypothetical protein